MRNVFFSSFFAGSLAIAALLSSCGYALERRRVERIFESRHQCASSEARSGGGGWWVEGCGVRAHYVCVDDDHDRPFLGAVVWGNSGCIRDGYEQRPDRIEGVSNEPRVRTRMHDEGFPIVDLTIPAPPARVRLLGAPTRDADRILFEVARPGRSTVDANCVTRVFVDGYEVALQESHVADVDGTLRTRSALATSDLGRFASATRITGILCGEAFEIPSSTFGLIRDYDIRFRELVASGADAPALVDE